MVLELLGILVCLLGIACMLLVFIMNDYKEEVKHLTARLEKDNTVYGKYFKNKEELYKALSILDYIQEEDCIVLDEKDVQLMGNDYSSFCARNRVYRIETRNENLDRRIRNLEITKKRK